jgi:hypothetical protein
MDTHSFTRRGRQPLKTARLRHYVSLTYMYLPLYSQLGGLEASIEGCGWYDEPDVERSECRASLKRGRRPRLQLEQSV